MKRVEIPSAKLTVTFLSGKGRLAKYAGNPKIEDISPHLLRHTWCKYLADSGARLEVIAALAGHESLETTRRYVEPGQDDLAAAVDRLAGGQE